MRFILGLTLREIRSSWRRLLFFFLCIALGVGSIVALRSLIQNLTHAVGTDARALMTADIDVSSTNDFSPSDIEKIESAVSASGIVEARNEAITTAVMARPVDAANEKVRFVELKGVEPPFPLVGEFNLDGGVPFDHALLTNNGAVVARILLEDLDVKIGDKIRIGEGEFEIRASFDQEPGGTSGFRLGARVFIAKRAFDDAGITRNSGRVRRRILYRTSDDPTPLVTALRESLRGTTIQVQSYRETQENLGEQFTRTENYLALTGLLILVLGGVGVWNVARAFVEQKRKTVAVLKCLGASGTRVITVYLLQILVLGIVGSLFGVVLAQLGLLLVRSRFAGELPENMSYAISTTSSMQGIFLGVLISLLFSALPLLQIRNIKPRLLLRDESNTSLRLDWTKWLVGTGSLFALLALSVWQAGSLRVGAFFLGGLAATTLVLYLTGAALTAVLRRLRKLGPFAISQAINSLYRPGNQTRIVLLAVGLGAFVVLTVQSLQSNLVREFDFTRNQRLPSLFFVDIGRTQIDELVRMVEERTGERAETTPTVRARIAFINGQPIDFQQREVRQQQGQIGREFAVTYRPNLDENESIVSGDWWHPGRPADVPEVSVEEDMAERLKIGVGDSITYDISGRKITAQVANIRRLDLRNTRTAFVFVFRPGALESAPQSYAATVLSRIQPTERQRLQRDVLAAFPNVQIFDVADIVAVVQRLVGNFVLAITFVGGFVVVSGILILIGSIALTKSQRVYENAIMKTLGAKRGTLASILLAEYGLLGILSGVVGAGFAVLLSWGVAVYIMDIEWEFDASLALGGVAITTAIVMLVGAAASFDVLFRKPLQTLRSQ